jgi:tetratricopeptide (TPR) repeat protein
LDPKFAPAWVERSTAHWGLQQYDMAITDATKAIELDANNPWAWDCRARTYNRMREYGKGIADASKAIDVDPNNLWARVIRGSAHEGLHQYDQALADFTKAIELKPTYIWAMVCRARTYSSLHQYDKAVADYSKAIELAPTNSGLHNNVAWLLATSPEEKLGDPKRAVELARKAVETAPREGAYWNTLGAAHYRAGSWQDAIAALEKSMELRTGGDAFDWFFLGMAHQKLGKKAEARQWYDRAVQWMEKNAPKDEELLRFRAEAEEVLGIEKESK